MKVHDSCVVALNGKLGSLNCLLVFKICFVILFAVAPNHQVFLTTYYFPNVYNIIKL